MTEEPPKKNERSSKAKTAAVALAALFLILILFFGIRAAQQVEPPQPFDNLEPRVSYIRATLDPPYTHYAVFTTDLDEDVLTFTWTLDPAEPACTDFTTDGSTASWKHDGDGCSHDRPDAHGGTITVVVGDGTHEVTRTYTDGAAEHEPDPLYPPG